MSLDASIKDEEDMIYLMSKFPQSAHKATHAETSMIYHLRLL